MFDTHAHLNFEAFAKKRDQLLQELTAAGVSHVLIPGTEVSSSTVAADMAQSHKTLYAAAGIHPHHVFDIYLKSKELDMEETLLLIQQDLNQIEALLSRPEVVAVGEIGLDRHMYQKTRYSSYEITDAFLDLQKQIMEDQIRLAITHQKSVVFHNREAADTMLTALQDNWDPALNGKTVLHCCEPNPDLLRFAIEHDVYIGVDGDVTYSDTKHEFLRQVPEHLLVIETDSPFLVPEPLRGQGVKPNTPSHLKLIAEEVARVRQVPVEDLIRQTTQNGLRLFGLA